jgi:CDP-diacylglycerol--glycerol-3-phosphate 3-phosphatidyltransferase
MAKIDFVDKKRMLVSNKYVTLANFFSVSRVLVAPFIIWEHMINGASVIFTLLVVYAILSDYLDGWAARFNNEITEFGKIADPVADKLLAGILFIYAAWLGLIPLWFVWGFLIRDLLILAGSIYIGKTRGKVAMSVMSGKIFVNFLAVYWLLVMFFPLQLGLITVFFISTTTLLLTSFIEYFVRFIRIVKGAEFN